MIVGISHENIFANQSITPTGHRPYFLIKDNGQEIPILDNVIDISEPFEVESYVNWDKKLKVRRIYLTHPSVTPKVSTEYFKLGFECYEFSVPYLHRIAADLAAEGKWPLDTHGEWTDIRCLIYDIEDPKGDKLIQCLGIGTFTMKIKTTVDLEHEIFELDLKIPDECQTIQLLCNNRSEEFEKILVPFVNYLQNSDIIIGHNVLEYDNESIYEKLKEYQQFSDYIKNYTYVHKGFFRGKTVEKLVTFYPMTFDTLLVARFLWKDESDVGYGLKNLAIKFKIARSNRVYERHFGGFGKWSNENPLCLEYNADDIQETFGLFKMQAKAILVNMLISGESFEDVISGSNGRMADQMTLIRSYNKEINGPMINPGKAARGLYGHFHGELKSKREIFDFFRNHTKCTTQCIIDEDTAVDMLKYTPEDDGNIEPVMSEEDWKVQENILRLVKYGEEMPDWIEYYPFMCGELLYGGKKYTGYVSTGGKTVYPTEPMVPEHDVSKADVAAQYPSILKAKNITANTVKLSRKGDPVDGWCWFRAIKHTEILELFEWRPATDFAYSDGEGYFIGYHVRNKEGYVNSALTGIINAVGKYKKMKGWEDAYQKALKPLRNAMSVHKDRCITLIDNKGLHVDTIKKLSDEFFENWFSNVEVKQSILNGIEYDYVDISTKNISTISVDRNCVFRIGKINKFIRHKYNGTLLKITTKGGSTIVSPNHSLFTLNNGNLIISDASKICVGDKIVSLASIPQNYFPTSEYSYRMHKSTNRQNKKVPDEVPLSEDLAELIGYYVSEGWMTYDETHGDRLSLSGSDDEFKERVHNLINKTLGLKCYSLKREGCWHIQCSGVFAKQIFGRYGISSIDKRITDELFNSSREIIIKFLNAYIYGDGSAYYYGPRLEEGNNVSKTIHTDYIKMALDGLICIRISTVSEKLANQLSLLFKLIGLNMSCMMIDLRNRDKNWTNPRGFDVHANYVSYQLRTLQTGSHYHSIMFNNIENIQVDSIEILDYNNYLYDLEVEEYNNFIDASGLLLHNTHGVLLSLDSTCQQFNLAGCAIPTLGQAITTHLNNYIEENGWKVLETDTDGTEFKRKSHDAADFNRLVKDVEAYWKRQIGHPILFDIEHSKHKLFIAHKNYITIKDNDDIKLTGNTLHSADKPKIYERCLKRIIREILPNVNTSDDLLSEVLQKTSKIVNEEFLNINDDDLMIIGKVSPSESYTNEVNAGRTIALEKLVNTRITFPTKMEFIVCVERLPETTGNKSETDPICYMYPRHLIDDLGKTRDYVWYKNMVFANIDTIFRFEKVSSRTPTKSIFTFDPSIDEKVIKIPKRATIDAFNNDDKKGEEKSVTTTKKQTSLF